MSFKAIEYRQLIQIITIFLIVQFFGLFLATQLFNGQTYQSAITQQISNAPIGALFLFAYAVLIAVVVLVMIKRFKPEKILIIWEKVIILITAFFVFYIILSTITSDLVINPNDYVSVYTAISLILAIIILYIKQKNLVFRNIAAILSSLGIGLLLGLGFSPIIALILIGILAIYDFVAVFITKHMLTLANIAMKNNLALLVDVNEYKAISRSNLSKTEMSEYRKAIKQKLFSIPQGIKQKVGTRIIIPAGVALGAGDLAIPLMVSISFYKVYLNFTLSIFVAVGATFGLILTMYILKRYRRALPAIPPILLGILCSMLVYFLVFNALPF